MDNITCMREKYWREKWNDLKLTLPTVEFTNGVKIVSVLQRDQGPVHSPDHTLIMCDRKSAISLKQMPEGRYLHFRQLETCVVLHT